MNSDEPIRIDLTPAEQNLLAQGLAQWGGPAAPTDELAHAIGFRSSEDLWQGKGRELRDAIRRGKPLTREDWRRAQLATEIVFASDIVGAGADWPTVTGLSDQETITTLRIIQKENRPRTSPSPVHRLINRPRKATEGARAKPWDTSQDHDERRCSTTCAPNGGTAPR